MCPLLLALSLTVTPCDDWSTGQLVAEGTVVAAMAEDYHQTLQFKHYPALHEVNPLLGKYPSDTKIKRYFGSALVGQIALADLLGSSNRSLFLGGVLILEIGTVASNRHKLNYQQQQQQSQQTVPSIHINLAISIY
jgi:hypothetical protein